jgi:uncharacterized damage-inducible protein DinB
MTGTACLSRERRDIIETLDKHRGFLRQTLDGMSNEQIRIASTVSELSLGRIVKHVTATESTWRNFIVKGAAAFEEMSPDAYEAEWRLEDGDTVESLLASYAEAAAKTDALVAEVDFDSEHSLPVAPWFEPGASWSARRALLHIIAEGAQHAGHADIIREAIDGAKTMG